VKFEIPERQVGFGHGDFLGGSNGMKVEAVRRLIVLWRSDRVADAKVAG
jgi:hypothetical protein